jgi:hypothetical protein
VTPIEISPGRKEKHCELHANGCRVYFLTNTKNLLEQRAKVGYMTGFSNFLNAFRVWDPETKRVESFRDLKFKEEKFFETEKKTTGKVCIIREEEVECMLTVNMGFRTPAQIKNNK